MQRRHRIALSGRFRTASIQKTCTPRLVDTFSYLTFNFIMAEPEAPSDQWPWSSLEDMPETSTPLKVTVLLAFFYILYYLSCVVNKPKLVGGERGLQHYLIQHCPVLTERYWPKIWAFYCHFSTILRAILQSRPTSAFKYSR